MSNVLPFRERLMWHCAVCNCASYFLYNDKTVECVGCHTVGVDDGEWIINLPEPEPDKITKTDDDVIRVITWGSPELARRHTLKKIAAVNEAKELVAVAGWDKDGGMHSWFDIATQEEKDWMLRKLAQLTEHVANVDVTGN
jgi:hypothetical protein